MKEKLTYDDVLLVPQYSKVDSRNDVDLSSNVTPNIRLDTPLVSAPMDSVTNAELAQQMADNGGVGIIHRSADIDERIRMVKEVDGPVGASIGVGKEECEAAWKLEDAGADFICVDIAHAHLDKCLSDVHVIRQLVGVDLMVGNVATWEAARDLIDLGVESIKVGIGSGSHCTTRQETGVGVPQFSAVKEIAEKLDINQRDIDVTLVADGGIVKPGDAVKALMAGADSVMMGGIFGRCEASPEGGEVWGMASKQGKENSGNTKAFVEGVKTQVEEETTVPSVFIRFEDGMRSGMSYCGGGSIEEARRNAEFIKTTPSARMRNGGYAQNPKDLYR